MYMTLALISLIFTYRLITKKQHSDVSGWRPAGVDRGVEM
jgi:hypothetical protein